MPKPSDTQLAKLSEPWPYGIDQVTITGHINSSESKIVSLDSQEIKKQYLSYQLSNLKLQYGS